MLDDAAWPEPGLCADIIDLDDSGQPLNYVDACSLVKLVGTRLDASGQDSAHAVLWPGVSYHKPRTPCRWVELLDVCMADLVIARAFFMRAAVSGQPAKTQEEALTATEGGAQ